MIASFNVRYILSDRLPDSLDNPPSFVASDEGHGVFGSAGYQMPVAVADSDRGDFDQYFSGARRFKIDGFDLKRLLWRTKDCGTDLHGARVKP
jgi:hypothetical protein